LSPGAVKDIIDWRSHIDSLSRIAIGEHYAVTDLGVLPKRNRKLGLGEDRAKFGDDLIEVGT
jgi:hypothetical protein